ncbi:hypothetical protein LCGC14_0598830 [marine sediment metagenome]|uniref:Uncharacterized protein n=1 Tax=marine sediment metagenome TaxID=412755 RepID=A0A0F9RBC5_9ZZZZ
MGKRDKERKERVIAGTEPMIQHTKPAPMVKCIRCNVRMPEYAMEHHECKGGR